MKIPVTRSRTERPHEALLYFGIGFWLYMYRIVGRLRRYAARCIRVVVGIPTMYNWDSNLWFVAMETVLGRQFDWGGRLRKGNGGAQRFPQPVWKSGEECKGIRELDCKTDMSSRVERRA